MTTQPATSQPAICQNGRKMVPVSRHWMECTEPDNLTKYYYNISTGESSWVEPEEVRRCVKSLEQLGELVDKEERGKQVLRCVDQSAWQERVDAGGKTFYFNTVTKASVWEMPVEVREWRQATSGASGEEQRERRELEFMKMLEEKGVGVAWTWEDCLKEIISHPSYKALPTLTDRKACFMKYIDDLKHKKAREGKKTDPREDFIDGLISLHLTKTTRYSDIEDKLRRLECTERLSPRERLELFEAHIKQLNKQYRQAILDEVIDYLYSSRHEFGRVGWLDVKPALYARFPQVLPQDLLSAWQRYILDCEERTIAQAHREHAERVSQRDTCCLSFRRFLVTLYEAGKLDRLARYSDLIPQFHSTPDYISLSRINADLPLIIFLHYKDELEDEYEKDCKFVESLIRKPLLVDEHFYCLRALDPQNVASILGPNWRFVTGSCAEMSTVPVVGDPIIATTPTTNVAREAKETVMEMEQDGKSQHRPQIDKYKHLLKHVNPPIRLHSDYRDYEPVLREYAEHQILPEHLRREYFEKYQLYLKRKRVDDPPASSKSVKY